MQIKLIIIIIIIFVLQWRHIGENFENYFRTPPISLISISTTNAKHWVICEPHISFQIPILNPPPPFYYLEELMSFFKHLYHRILCQDCSLHTNKAKSIIALIVLITPIHSDNSFNTYLGTFFSSRVLTNLRLLDNLLVQERQLLQCIGLLGLPLPLPLP